MNVDHPFHSRASSSLTSHKVYNYSLTFFAALTHTLALSFPLTSSSFTAAGFKVHELRRKSKGDLLNQVSVLTCTVYVSTH